MHVKDDVLMTKMPKVLGEQVGNFSSMFTATVGNGANREQKIYNFPKREAMLMAMSYSYELQGQVFDVWKLSLILLI